MIELKITNYQAIDLQALLESLAMLANPEFPNDIRLSMLKSFEGNDGLGVLATVLTEKLNEVKRSQELKAGFVEGDRPCTDS